MRFSGSAPVDRGAGAVYAAMSDPGRLLAGIGAANPEPTAGSGNGSAAGTVTSRIGSLTATHDIRVTVVGSQPETRTVRYRVRGREATGQGDLDGLVTLRVATGETGANNGVLEVDADLDVRGQIARFGGDPLRAAVACATTRLAAALAEAPADVGDESAGPTAEPAGPTAESAGPAPEPAGPAREPAGPAAGERPRARVLIALTAVAVIAAVIVRMTRKAGDDGALRQD